ncbi:MAG: AraC family transcriptional regulator [Bacteroidales bacterium]|jgi:AraC-like DNA-binding protein|nr:AraC family transcriptional regulator [Bacteroidales bacterium]
MMKSIPRYDFYKTKYGEELLIDVVSLNYIKKYVEIHPVHTLSYFDITFIEEGTGCVSIDHKKYAVRPGDVIFSIPGAIRVWEENHQLNGYALIFEEEFLLSFFNDPLFLQHLAFFSPQKISDKINTGTLQTRIDYLLRNIIAEINHDTSKDKHLLRALLYEMLILLNREYKEQNKFADTSERMSNRHVDAFISLVNKYYNRNHDTRYYADKLCITPNYLNEVVKKSIGINAKLYLQNRILSEAKRMLVYTHLTVSEIAEQLNFDNTSYFIRFFRKHTGVTPLQYRENTKH